MPYAFLPLRAFVPHALKFYVLTLHTPYFCILSTAMRLCSAFSSSFVCLCATCAKGFMILLYIFLASWHEITLRTPYEMCFVPGLLPVLVDSPSTLVFAA